MEGEKQSPWTRGSGPALSASQWPRDGSGPGGKLLRHQGNPKPLGFCCLSGSYSPDTSRGKTKSCLPRTYPEIVILYFDYLLGQCIDQVPPVRLVVLSKWPAKS